MTLLHIVRHGQHNLVGRLAGRMDGVGLTERGQAEITSVAKYLGPSGIAAIYASPLQRTRESAEIIGRHLDVPVEFHDELLELDFGEWTGATFDAIRADPRWVAWNTCRSLACTPGGETMRNVQRRSVEALAEIAARYPENQVVVVSHGDVIRSMLVFALGMPLDFFNRIEVTQGSVSTIRIEPTGIRVVGINLYPYKA
ncbi:MAG: histidine phosphatase family protein [Alphaproteobacteria bacterium]|nr:histidine phosphatase family protein [Alphaproteobacteria bacterium]